MLRTMILPIFCLLLSSAGLALALTPAPIPIHLLPNKQPLYFPTTVGTKWVYQRGKEEWTEVITAVEKQDGTFIVTFGELSDNSKVAHPKRMAVSERGLAYLAGDKKQFDPEFQILKLPHKLDQTWLTDKQSSRYRSLKSECVTVPSGKFESLVVESSENPENPLFTDKERRWYAVGVGLVKSTYRPRLPPIELKEFIPGKE